MDTRTTRQKIEDLEKRLAKGVPAKAKSRLMTYYDKLKHEGARSHMRRLGLWYSNGAVQEAFEHAWADGGLTDGQIVQEMERWLTERYYPPNATAGTIG